MIYNIGSINADFFYYMAHLPAPGETLAADRFDRGLGGKGANQSVAAGLAGARVMHIGAIGVDGAWAVDRLAGYGIDTSQITTVDDATGHAIINVDKAGENSIVIYPGANARLSEDQITNALISAKPGDILLLQNETNAGVQAAKLGAAQGMRVLYSAAPFEVSAVQAILPHINTLILNEVEADQLTRATGQTLTDLTPEHIIVTKGSAGADLYGENPTHIPAFRADPIDTTGAGDCFAGYLAAGLDNGMTLHDAMQLGAAASAIKVIRTGTSDAFPTRQEVETFLAAQN